MLISRKAWSGPTWGYLILPVENAFQYPQVADSARQLIQAASTLAQRWMGARWKYWRSMPRHGIFGDVTMARLSPFPTWQRVAFISS
jgi:hypothetical protein